MASGQPLSLLLSTAELVCCSCIVTNYIDQEAVMTESFEPDLVSIITPAWRAAGYIEETIASVQAQTYSNWEMLIVDDFSPDNTCEVIEKHCTKDDRIHLIRLPQWNGARKSP